MSQMSLDLSAKELAKNSYILPRVAYITYIRNWANDIKEGLMAWPQLSHDIGKILLFNAPNMIDKEALADRWEIYRNQYFVKMMGGTNIASTFLIKNAELMDLLYPEAISDIVDNLKDAGRDAFLDALVRVFTLNNMTGDEFIELLEKPELKINTLVNNPALSLNGKARGIDLLGLNQLMGLTDTGSTNLNERFDENVFAPAFNTINMIKLMLLSEQGIVDLYNSLCAQSMSCTDTLTSTPAANAMLGFIRTLDGDNEWQNHNKKMLIASECGLYQQMFMLQTGEDSVGDENCVRFVSPQLITNFNVVLTPPEITAGGTFDVLPEITMSHADANVDIYYTINTPGSEIDPSNDPNDSRSHLYSQPFTLQAPFTGDPTQIIRAAAFKDGAQGSAVVEETFVITATQNAPAFFPLGQDFQGSVDVSLSADTGASIYYTINGEAPDYTSTKYTGPITLTQGQYTIRAVAYQLGIPQSEIVSKQYNVWNIDGSDNLAEPVLTPANSINVVDQIQLSMQSFDENAEIRYTQVLNSVYVEPTSSSTLYTSPITLTEGDWFIAVKAFDPTGVSAPSLTKFINISVSAPAGTVDFPQFEPNGGTFNNAVNVRITGETTPDNAGTPQRYYTTDGSDPHAYPYITANYNRFNGITLDGNTTLKAQALQTGFSASGIASARFNFVAATPVVTPANGRFVDQVKVSLSSATVNAKVYYTLDGSEPTENSNLYSAPFILTESATLRAKAMKNGYFDSEIATANFQIKPTTVPAFIQQPQSVSAFEGQDIVLSVLADGFPLPTYQWYKNNVLLQGEVEAKLFLNNLQATDAASYKVAIKNSRAETESNIATVSVNPLPALVEIIEQPASGRYQEGDTLSLQVVVGNPQAVVNYQWFHEGVAIIGANTSGLNINNIDIENAGRYWVEISNPAGMVKSAEAEVEIVSNESIQFGDTLLLPEITKQPESLELEAGNALVLSVEVESNPAASYQWFKNQQLLNNQNSERLLIDNISTEDAGDYFVLVSNSEGAVISNIAKVNVTSANNGNGQSNADNQSPGGGGSLNIFLLISFLLTLYWRVRGR